MQSTQVTFEVADTETERRFLREYLASAWERFEAMDAFESGWFWPRGRHARHGIDGLEPGKVVFVVNGDPERVVESEFDRWEELVERGLLDGWETQSFAPAYDDSLDKMQQKLGAVGGERNYRLRPLASGLTVALLREFDEPLPVVGEATEENSSEVGFWSLFHYLAKQNGYDWHDEIEACTKATKNRLRSLAAFDGEAAAQERLRETVTDLESFADELREWAGEDGAEPWEERNQPTSG